VSGDRQDEAQTASPKAVWLSPETEVIAGAFVVDTSGGHVEAS